MAKKLVILFFLGAIVTAGFLIFNFIQSDLRTSIVENNYTKNSEEPLISNETITKDHEDDKVIENSNEGNEAEENEEIVEITDILTLVNKDIALPEDYAPSDLVIPNVSFTFEGTHEKQLLRKEAAAALEELFSAAKSEGLYLYAVSGYRSYERQKAVYGSHVQRIGQAEADKISARPGHSEHQTGLAMDITSQSINFLLTEEFGDTIEGKWVAENAHKYGFIIRYEAGKEAITGYSYEPWHLRYVGGKAAENIYKNELTLEAFLTR